MMYSLTAILEKEPVAIAASIRSLLFIGVLSGLLVMDEQLLAAIALAAELILGLFVRAQVFPTATVQKIANAATEQPAGTVIDIGNPPQGETAP